MLVARGEACADPACFPIWRDIGTYRGVGRWLVSSLARQLDVRHRAWSQARDDGVFHLELSG